MSMKKVIMVAGTERSGSTLLDLMLGNASDGFSAGEIVALFRPYAPHHILKDRNCFCDEADCDFWLRIKKGGEKKLYENLFNELGVEFIVDSSKNPLWIKDQIKYSKNQEYEIIPVIIYKSPIEFAYSKDKRGKLKGWDQAWTGTYKRLFHVFDDINTVEYKGLANDPGKKLESICKSIGIEYFEGKEKFWNNKSEHLLFGSGTVKKSDRLVYYEQQYDMDKLKRLKKIVQTTTEIEDIYKVLQSFDVDSSNNNKYHELKRKLSQFSTLNLIKLKTFNTPYYPVNTTMKRIIKGIIGHQ